MASEALWFKLWPCAAAEMQGAGPPRLLPARHQRAYRYVFIDFRPVNADSFPDQAPILALSHRSISQAREPFQRRRNLAAVRQNEMERRFVD